MIFKILAFLVVIFLVYIIFFKKNREKDINNKKYDEITDTLVECPTCKTYISKDEAVLSNGKYFCSKGCLR
jgi:uncharacterized protein